MIPQPVDIPHQGAMRWIDLALVSPDGCRVEVHAAIPPDHPFVHKGALRPSALIEYMAQAAAAGCSRRAADSGRRVKRGLLVAIPQFEAFPPVSPGHPLDITAFRERTFGALAQFRFEIHQAARLVARARMTFHLELE